MGDVTLLHSSECGRWTAMDTSTMMSSSQLTSGQRWSLMCLSGGTESKPAGAHPAHCAPWQQPAAHPMSPTLPALGDFWPVGNRQELWATQPSSQTLPILRQMSCVQTSLSERRCSVVRAGCQSCALLPASSTEKTLESTCLLTDSCSVGLVF